MKIESNRSNIALIDPPHLVSPHSTFLSPLSISLFPLPSTSETDYLALSLSLPLPLSPLSLVFLSESLYFAFVIFNTYTIQNIDTIFPNSTRKLGGTYLKFNTLIRGHTL